MVGLGKCIVGDLFDVVNHTVKEPLYVDFDLSPEREAIETLFPERSPPSYQYLGRIVAEKKPVIISSNRSGSFEGSAGVALPKASGARAWTTFWGRYGKPQLWVTELW